MIRTTCIVCYLSLCLLFSGSCLAIEPFVVKILDAETGRGVPLVELFTADNKRYITDSNGIVSGLPVANPADGIDLSIRSYGYSSTTRTIHPVAGGTHSLEIARINLAERIYRATGEDIYIDSVRANIPVPIEHPLGQANVRGQDSVQMVMHRGKIHWFWGDTTFIRRKGKFKGIYRTTGATSMQPADGGLDPDLGINFSYFTRNGTVREMMPITAPGPIWVAGMFEVEAPSGGRRILGYYTRVKGSLPDPFQLHEHGLLIYSDPKQQLQRLLPLPLDAPIYPLGHPFRHDGYIYFGRSYPNIRVKDSWSDVVNIANWEAYSPFQTNSRYARHKPPLVTDSQGRPLFAWRKNTTPATHEMIAELVQGNYLNSEDSPYDTRDVETGRAVHLVAGSVNWNAFRQAWTMIAVEARGDSPLGEIWYSEAPTPEGPWQYAIKVVTHHDILGNYSFYNPTAMPIFQQQDGRIIYFQGTYSKFLTQNEATPLYDYNQIVYKLDLARIPSPLEPVSP